MTEVNETGDEWRAVLTRVRGLVTDAVEHDGERALDLTVPACPDWTVHDLLAHMVGLVADVLGGDEADDHDAAWTQAQVDARRDRTGREILDEWESHSDAMLAHLTDDPRPLGDAIIHEQDLRGALERPGARSTEGLRVVRESMATMLGDALGDLPPVTLLATDDGWSWSSGPEHAGVVLEASGFDLFRALTSRRTAAELGSWVVDGDVAPYLDAFAQLGPLPTHRLPE